MKWARVAVVFGCLCCRLLSFRSLAKVSSPRRLSFHSFLAPLFALLLSLPKADLSTTTSVLAPATRKTLCTDCYTRFSSYTVAAVSDSSSLILTLSLLPLLYPLRLQTHSLLWLQPFLKPHQLLIIIITTIT